MSAAKGSAWTLLAPLLPLAPVLLPVLLPGSGAAAEPVPGASQSASDARSVEIAERVTFDEAVAHALRRNVSVTAAQLDLQRAMALVVQSRAASLPTLSLAANYTRLDNDRILGSGDMQRLVAGADQLAGTVTVSVPLLAPARWAQWLHARDNQRLAEISQSDVRRQIAVAAAHACLSVIAQLRLVDVGERAEKTAQGHSEYASQRLVGGVGNRLDAVRAESERQLAASQLAIVRSTLARSREALGVILAADHAVDCREAPSFADANALVDAMQASGPDAHPAAAALSSLDLLRTDLRLWQARAWASARVIRHGWTDFLPQLNVSFAPFFQDPPSIVQPVLGWQARVDFNWTLFDGGQRYGVRSERWVLYKQTKNSQLAAQLQARSEVRAAVATLQHTAHAESAAQAAARWAEEASLLSLQAYRAGISNNLAVIDAERRARDADTAAVQAEDATRQARLDLLIAAGQFPAAHL